MGTVRHSRSARQDLIDIWLTIAHDNPGAADRMLGRLEARVKILEQFPQIGMARPDIASTARVLVVRPYLILYRLIPDGVQIVRVLHGARNIDGDLFKQGIN